MIPKQPEERYIVCKRNELKPGEIRRFKVGRRRLAVMCVGENSYRAISDSCPHEGASLSKGKIEKMWISEEVGQYQPSENRVVAVCPWHNFEFDVDTGITPNKNPRLRVRTYKAEAEGNDVVVYV